MEDFLIEPPAELYEKIIKFIRREERFLAIRRIALFSTTLVISLAGFYPVTNMLVSNLNQSGFLNFLGLTFSDFKTVATYWQSFAMILLESLPALSLALFLAVLLTFLQSIKVLSKDAKNIYEHRKLFSV